VLQFGLDAALAAVFLNVWGYQSPAAEHAITRRFVLGNRHGAGHYPLVVYGKCPEIPKLLTGDHRVRVIPGAPESQGILFTVKEGQTTEVEVPR
jgi:hypothetical protein